MPFKKGALLIMGIGMGQNGYHRDFLHKIWFNDFNTSLISSLIKISTLKIVQLLRYSQGNTQSIFYVIISNLLFLFPQ